jgi:tetratricopeptide (TPR) repeat protein
MPAFFVVIVLLIVGYSACKTMTAMTEVHKGRQALMAGKAQTALAHFQRAVELDPDFLYFSTLPQSAVTYSGRVLYQLGKLPEARQAFEQATLRFKNDLIARLYLGLTLARQGHQEQGVNETTAGLKAIYEWLDYIEANLPQGVYWDTSREIRSEIERILNQTSDHSLPAGQLTAAAEWIGNRIEQEIDLARRDEQASRNRNG